MKVSQKLYEAYRNNEPLSLGIIDVDNDGDAYRIQDEVLKKKESDGERLKGYKISLTSSATQEMFKSDAPLYGGMTDKSVADEISLSDFNMPFAEMELVFLVGEELTPRDTAEDILNKCLVAPGMEIPDGRYQEWFPNATKYEVISDGAVNGAVVYGEGRRVRHEDIDDIKGELSKDGELVQSGRSTEVLGHPVESVKWLIKALDQSGKRLLPGMFVSSGTFILPVRLEPGKYTARYEKMGAVSLTVTR